MMNKHQTLVYLKYGKLISEINDKITVPDIKSDMIKFLIKFPGNLKYPTDIDQSTSEKYGIGIFLFKITKPSEFLEILFHGKNTFEIWPYTEWTYNYSTWASIDNIEHYVDIHLDIFHNIIE